MPTSGKGSGGCGFWLKPQRFDPPRRLRRHPLKGAMLAAWQSQFRGILGGALRAGRAGSAYLPLEFDPTRRHPLTG